MPRRRPPPPDEGRTVRAGCGHLAGVTARPAPDGGCEECLAIGGSWLHLRFCYECDRKLCCDGSPNRHARRHALEAGHPVACSAERGESWAWCYQDETILEPIPPSIN
jgi:hypothetical protein